MLPRFSYTRLAADVGKNKQFTGLTAVVKQITQKEGVSGLYRGYPTSVAGIIIYRAGYFGFYDAGKQIFFKDGGENTSIFLKFGLAMAVDISAAVLAYPIDTVRRRLMMQSGEAAVQFDSAASAFSYILKNEGASGFYRGCMANNVRAIASALVLVLYDEAKKFTKEARGREVPAASRGRPGPDFGPGRLPGGRSQPRATLEGHSALERGLSKHKAVSRPPGFGLGYSPRLGGRARGRGGRAPSATCSYKLVTTTCSH